MYSSVSLNQRTATWARASPSLAHRIIAAHENSYARRPLPRPPTSLSLSLPLSLPLTSSARTFCLTRAKLIIYVYTANVFQLYIPTAPCICTSVAPKSGSHNVEITNSPRELYCFFFSLASCCYYLDLSFCSSRSSINIYPRVSEMIDSPRGEGGREGEKVPRVRVIGMTRPSIFAGSLVGASVGKCREFRLLQRLREEFAPRIIRECVREARLDVCVQKCIRIILRG